MNPCSPSFLFLVFGYINTPNIRLGLPLVNILFLVETTSFMALNYIFAHLLAAISTLNINQSINQFYFLLSATSLMPLALYNGTHTLV